MEEYKKVVYKTAYVSLESGEYTRKDIEEILYHFKHQDSKLSESCKLLNNPIGK